MPVETQVDNGFRLVLSFLGGTDFLLSIFQEALGRFDAIFSSFLLSLSQEFHRGVGTTAAISFQVLFGAFQHLFFNFQLLTLFLLLDFLFQESVLFFLLIRVFGSSLQFAGQRVGVRIVSQVIVDLVDTLGDGLKLGLVLFMFPLEDLFLLPDIGIPHK